MSFKIIKKIPEPDEIKNEYPVPAGLPEKKKEIDKEVADVIKGYSDKFLVIIGPCSADNEDAVLDYT